MYASKRLAYSTEKSMTKKLVKKQNTNTFLKKPFASDSTKILIIDRLRVAV